MNVLIDWFQANKLTLNLNKTNFILFTPKHSRYKPNKEILNLKFGDQKINQVKETKFLGVYIDKHLTFEHHIKQIGTKLNKLHPDLQYDYNIQLQTVMSI